jgi:hypothetical protein
VSTPANAESESSFEHINELSAPLCVAQTSNGRTTPARGNLRGVVKEGRGCQCRRWSLCFRAACSHRPRIAASKRKGRASHRIASHRIASHRIALQRFDATRTNELNSLTTECQRIETPRETKTSNARAGGRAGGRLPSAAWRAQGATGCGTGTDGRHEPEQVCDVKPLRRERRNVAKPCRRRQVR